MRKGVYQDKLEMTHIAPSVGIQYAFGKWLSLTEACNSDLIIKQKTSVENIQDKSQKMLIFFVLNIS